MKLKLLKPGARRDWINHPLASGILLEKDLAVGSTRLRAKLLVFDTSASLRAFWKKCLAKGELGRRCLGAVNGLFCEVVNFTKKGGAETRYLEADPRYFCVIGLIKPNLSMNIICHEAVHAAFCYAKRIKRSPWDERALDFDEEAICYPAGEIAAEINRALYGSALY